MKSPESSNSPCSATESGMSRFSNEIDQISAFTSARYEGNRYQQTVDFCAQYDEVSFDPAYKNEPMSTFEPMVRRLLNRPWLPPASVGDR
jgi:hypothetical protein